MAANKPKRAENFPMHTSMGMDALNRAAADGKSGRNYENSEYPASRVHRVPGNPHRVELRADDAGIEAIEQLTSEQDADTALAILYIVGVLAPPGAASDVPAQGTIDYDDVIAKIGWTPRNAENRRELQRRIHGILRFGERAVVIGRVSGGYKDKDTGKRRDVEIESSLWRIHSLSRPEQGALFDEVPISAEIVISREWVKMLADMKQFLPCGEVLGAIPGAKPSGAWARVIGLSLASFWRRNPREAIDGSLKPTRRELLERYTPKTGSVEDVLGSRDPRRAIDYWCAALSILVEAGIVENDAEAVIGYEAMRESFGRQGWADEWLNQSVEIRPGHLMKPTVKARAVDAPARKTFRK